jgi:hypothetical protein
MKPTTKLHHQVCATSQKLNALTESQHKLAVKNIFSKYGTTSHKTIFCLECSHSWKDAEVFIQRPKHLICPSCKGKIQMLTCSSEYQSNSYFTKIDAKDNFQIVRIFFMEKLMKKGTIPMYYTSEVMQHFVGLNGRVTSMAMAVSGNMGMYYDSWRCGSELSIMANDFLNTNRGRIESDYVLPRATFLKEVTRNGFNGNYHDMAPQKMFSILMNQKAETLLKTNQTDLLRNFNSKEHQINRYWQSIKICIRNNYNIQDATIWLDTVRLLDHFDKDLLSTKYVCPEDLHKAHNKLVAKKRAQDDIARAEGLIQKLKDQEKAYAKDKKAFFGICFSNGNITIKVIGSVQDFINEGRELHHCIYTNKYFAEKNSLILSATIDNKRIETIEFSLKEMKIVQARGLQNKASKFNKEIKSLVKDNLYQIQKITNLKSA